MLVVNTVVIADITYRVIQSRRRLARIPEGRAQFYESERAGRRPNSCDPARLLRPMISTGPNFFSPSSILLRSPTATSCMRFGARYFFATRCTSSAEEPSQSWQDRYPSSPPEVVLTISAFGPESRPGSPRSAPKPRQSIAWRSLVRLRERPDLAIELTRRGIPQKQQARLQAFSRLRWLTKRPATSAD